MLRMKKGKFGLLIIGTAALIWGITSAFTDWRTLVTLQPGPLDNPDAAGSQWIYATANPSLHGSTPAPTPFGPDANATPESDAPAFTIPYVASPTANPAPASKPVAVGMAPDRIVIPAIHLDAPIIKVPYRLVKDDTSGQVFQQWLVPDKFAVGWQSGSAMLGVPGNTVLDGHHNVWGMVFRYLVDLKPGDKIEVFSGNTRFDYQISNKMILPERNQALDVRFSNARWIETSTDERLTLVTCWPFTSNTHRLIIVALPIGRVTVGD